MSCIILLYILGFIYAVYIIPYLLDIFYGGPPVDSLDFKEREQLKKVFSIFWHISIPCLIIIILLKGKK